MLKKVESAYVSFKIAKWLKEKGFDVSCVQRFTSMIDSDGVDKPKNFNQYINAVSKPEQWQVIEWLRVKYDIWISVEQKESRNFIYWEFIIDKGIKVNDRFEIQSQYFWDTPQKAYSAAIDYIKENNLI